ncbi:uncharacterized protein LOC130973535 [Arachis stenosperma]|uniref:uncharacterized protein LOC130973535 n=1 Tax=Arachis stenosperma TaxID=217475 RepID=UPI0025AB810D|nr:uncharacterized protein LOC130973535 [Arachis stenosperma]
MASSMKPSSRYSTYDSRSSTSSHFSDPSSSSDFTTKPHSSSRALVNATKKVDPSLTTMVKKLIMQKKPKSTNHQPKLIVPSDLIAQQLKKDAKKATGLSSLQKKLFGGKPRSSEVKALTEVKGNTRTLAMVLRSERELLTMNKEQEGEISQLKILLDEKNKEVEKLKDLCLKQREEIKSLKSAILFPDTTNSELQELVEKQSSELKQAKMVIPTLQQQVTSLTGQLQTLAEDLAEVKADKYSAKTSFQGYASSPRTPTHAREDSCNSWDFSSDDQSDDLLLKDLNPCLTPVNTKSRSRDSEVMGSGSGSLPDESLSVSEEDVNVKVYPEIDFSSFDRKFSKSSDCCHNSTKKSVATTIKFIGRRSDESKVAYGGRVNHRFA